METPATEPRVACDEHDAVLALALGSLAVARGFEACVIRPALPGSQPLEADDPIVLAALGAISLGRSLTRWLEEAAQRQHPRRLDPPTRPAPTSRELLR